MIAGLWSTIPRRAVRAAANVTSGVDDERGGDDDGGEGQGTVLTRRRHGGTAFSSPRSPFVLTTPLFCSQDLFKYSLRSLKAIESMSKLAERLGHLLGTLFSSDDSRDNEVRERNEPDVGISTGTGGPIDRISRACHAFNVYLKHIYLDSLKK